ncbi:sulfatase [Roseibacillus ishigakijimensis]|uniref:Sulfatase n=1 Tax=Roseibacillus ishigakijimensis TaxID=454146 RepID=A0A934RP46_9BACT|nr:sulfatase [Roseibacillus ishigakijimensis]MBK1832903.1 sulfatase [Roseibacillus ishigakijimensis]
MARIVILLLVGVLVSVAEEETRPNVLFIAVDDLNDWAGYRGDEQVISPHMDGLAEEGVWFSRAYCQYPVCGPSRASVMGGIYYHQYQSQKLQMDDEVVAEKLHARGSALLHERFKEAGYTTMAVGKILHKHLPAEHLDLSGGRGGWGTYRDEDGGRRKLQWKSQKTLTDWGRSPTPEPKMSDSKAAAWAAARLGEEHEEPFLLMVGFLRPHVPWYVPQEYFDRYDREKIQLPPYRADDLADVPAAGRATLNEGYPRTEWAQEEDQWRDIVQAYLASITFVDDKIGQVLQALEASPYRDNTIVVLWSDHGYHLGEKNTFQKHTLWERSALSPLIIKVPEADDRKIAPGKCERVVSLLDLYPTLLELCGLPANKKAEGRSLVPLLENKTATWDHPALTYRKDGGRSLRDERYRYIVYGDGSEELYDHETDPNEWHNLAEENEAGEILGRMRKKLAAAHVE